LAVVKSITSLKMMVGLAIKKELAQDKVVEIKISNKNVSNVNGNESKII